MRRVAHLLLLVFAVVGLVATADRGLERLDVAAAVGVASDPSQLSESLPAARIDRATLTNVDAVAPCDRVDARSTRQLIAAVLPGAVAASSSGVCESAPGDNSAGIGTVATCPCGRGPPEDPAPTSI